MIASVEVDAIWLVVYLLLTCFLRLNFWRMVAGVGKKYSFKIFYFETVPTGRIPLLGDKIEHLNLPP